MKMNQFLQQKFLLLLPFVAVGVSKVRSFHVTLKTSRKHQRLKMAKGGKMNGAYQPL